ncbi:NAD(P)/FAD-dependent oxidoreductase [Thermogymnomonas acidicola]|uniref:NAD(P)/FAD-dependent oxidoreductase n=1 Tax=Thermogymnomonas acidicola TaxID=399579 RepID=UPI0013969410|nr:FAD/NAD(P)-binding oxidoreductase [Thermogymnomonas acidicola]
MAAASKAKRVSPPHASVTVLEAGRFVSYAECGMPYYLQGIVKDLEDLLHYPPVTEFTQRRGIDVRTGCRVTEIDTGKQVVKSQCGDFPYDRLIIASGGASPVLPPELSSPDVHTLRSMEEASSIKASMRPGSEVAIVGGGVLGTELASALSEGGFRVTLVVRKHRLISALSEEVSALVAAEMEGRVKILWDTTVASVEGKGGQKLLETSSGQVRADVVIAATGVRPNSRIASDAGIQTTGSGAIRVDERCLTSEPGVYAAGDVAACRDLVTGDYGWFPLAQVSNKMGGRVAGGANAAGGEMSFPGGPGGDNPDQDIREGAWLHGGAYWPEGKGCWLQVRAHNCGFQGELLSRKGERGFRPPLLSRWQGGRC